MRTASASVLVAQSLDPIIFPQLARLTANLASMEGLQLGSKKALVNGVIRKIDIDAQAAELLFHLQDFELASACSISATLGLESWKN